MTDLLKAARLAHEAGLCVVPAAKDGSKRPFPSPSGRWDAYKSVRSTEAELEGWFFDEDRFDGFGIVCGAVSGGLEMLELEGRAVEAGLLDQMVEGARALGILDLFDRVASGYQESTPSGGIHWLYRCDEVSGNLKLARDVSGDVAIETRGEGGFVIVAPSGGLTHPSGREWQLVMGGFDEIVTITPEERAALHSLCRTFDTAVTTDTRDVVAPHELDRTRPGDDFISRTNWRDPRLLLGHGWVEVYDHGGTIGWRRPGKEGTAGDLGISATTNHNGTDCLYVFSSSVDQFTPERNYNRFSAYAILNHAGDFSAAARKLAEEGYGEQVPATLVGSDAVERPVVVVGDRPSRDIEDDILMHLLEGNVPPTLFVRSGYLTRVRSDERGRPIIDMVTKEILKERIGRVMDTVTMGKNGPRHKSVPDDHVKSIMAHDSWPFPALNGVTEIPTLRPDGTVHFAEGYDPQTGLLHRPARGLAVPPTPPTVTRDDAVAASAVFFELLADFPFESDADRANAIGLLISPIVRPAFTGHVPMCLIDAPEPGTGKGLLANLVAIIATGRHMAAKPMSRSEEEVKKMLLATLQSTPSVVVLDNIEDAIKSPTLASLLTSDVYEDRILGTSVNLQVENLATWIATGNNVRVAGDIGRRCYRIRLDAKRAKPYQRTGFRHSDLITYAQSQRGELISAALVMARAWWQAGRPVAEGQITLGSFSPWASTVGGILTFAGVNGFLGNFDRFQEEADDDALEWEALLATWHDAFGPRVMTVADIAAHMQDDDSVLRNFVPSAAVYKLGKADFKQKLGNVLKSRAGRRYGDQGLHLVSMPRDRRKIALWSVQVDSPNGLVTTAGPEIEKSRGEGPESANALHNISTLQFEGSTAGPDAEKSRGPAVRESPGEPTNGDSTAGLSTFHYLNQRNDFPVNNTIAGAGGEKSQSPAVDDDWDTA